MLQYPPQPPTQQQQQQQQQQQPDALAPHTMPALRLRDDPGAPQPNPATSQTTQPPPKPSTTTRSTRKRKSPPTATSGPPPPPPPQPQPQHPPPPPGMHLGQILPPPHALMPPGMPHPPPPMYQYAPPDYSQPPPHPSQGDPQQSLDPQDGDQGLKLGPGGRQLSQSKRAEQNRKAQRAFRERRDQHVKALESRSQLLDAALASADEANRRWEECRALVDQLRIENAALRAALSQTQIGGQLAQGQILPPPPPPPQQPSTHENGHEAEKTESPAVKE